MSGSRLFYRHLPFHYIVKIGSPWMMSARVEIRLSVTLAYQRRREERDAQFSITMIGNLGFERYRVK